MAKISSCLKIASRVSPLAPKTEIRHLGQFSNTVATCWEEDF